ncbi:hypothetical protein DPMN_188082 [Dreissena polymorpha]|uniref:Uncharacterized protein n=1 Tax=Dreissena polymorpha TaxID=45954 RepID=A0A9D4I9L8_DREPO|nr:hypothetical protein DPMN_188082 [Dreissena polymorpha]
MKFESSAAVQNGTQISGVMLSNFIQFAADNVDHNVRTLDGHDTFHGMGSLPPLPLVSKKKCLYHAFMFLMKTLFLRDQSI